MRVMRVDMITEVLDTALDRSLRGLGWIPPGTPPEVEDQPVTQLKARVRFEFARLVRERTQVVRAVTRSAFLRELDRSRDEALEARDRAQAELDALRARAQANPGRAVGDASIETYERRIAKLNEALERAEEALVQGAAAEQGGSGLASAYREAQGLSPDADRRALRLALLGEIFAANQRLQRV